MAVLFFIFLGASVPAYLAEPDPNGEIYGWVWSNNLLAFACIFGFLYQLHFLRGLKLTGCLVVMIFEMLKTDIFAWFGVFIFVMMAFMTGYLALFMTHPLRSILTVGNTSYQETAE
jgi:hypothetical protein